MAVTDFLLHKVGSALWMLAIGVLLVFGWIAVLGGITPLSLIVLVLAAGTLVAVYLLRRARTTQDEGMEAEMEVAHDTRERRGF